MSCAWLVDLILVLRTSGTSMVGMGLACFLRIHLHSAWAFLAINRLYSPRTTTRLLPYVTEKSQDLIRSETNDVKQR